MVHWVAGALAPVAGGATGPRRGSSPFFSHVAVIVGLTLSSVRMLPAQVVFPHGATCQTTPWVKSPVVC